VAGGTVSGIPGCGVNGGGRGNHGIAQSHGWIEDNDLSGEAV
jgi:hypothetical protein